MWRRAHVDGLRPRRGGVGEVAQKVAAPFPRRPFGEKDGQLVESCLIDLTVLLNPRFAESPKDTRTRVRRNRTPDHVRVPLELCVHL